MADSILDRYRGHKVLDGERGSIDSQESDVAEDLGAFGWLRGIRDRAWMLELRKRDGNILAIGYGWLDRAEFDPSEGITLFLSGRTVRIKGRHLNGNAHGSQCLFQGIARHRVPWIREADDSVTFEARAGATVIDSIEW